ncbi:nitric oxide reductase activation protein NorD [Mycobacterium sp. pUA109]|uniref:nitric oxide reductase activation protein NorD n=1 Tax=Mycobacterium sp. pUA109 TaxID=3238982 RepID=UPI00351B9219
MTNQHHDAEALQRWNLLASALSGRAVRVAVADPGEPACTDGKTVFIGPDTDAARQLEVVAVQACLLAAGSLEPGIARKLNRRRALAHRYLAIEGHRALACNAELLPPAVRTLIDHDLAARSNSPATSLRLARDRTVRCEPPECFGVIQPRKLLAASGDHDDAQHAGQHLPRQQRRPLEDLDAEDRESENDPFSSPVGGGAAFGRMVAKMLAVTRRLGSNGPPGADAPTHRTRSGIRSGGAAVASPAASGIEEGMTASADAGTAYHEWDVHRRCYRPNWCTVLATAPGGDSGPAPRSAGHGLRRPLARLGVGLDRCHRQAQGDDVDLDAAIESRVEAIAGSAPDEAVYLDSLRRRRDLSVLILLDISGSTAEPATQGRSVHEQQRSAAAALTTALHDLGDRVALYAFHSQGRTAVHVAPVKRFHDAWDVAALRRLGGLRPGAYSRLGAAIRHGATVLERRGGTPRQLLVVLSDGLAYDHGYDRGYGAADARRALAEARHRGIGCLCLTIGAATDAEELRRVFGNAAHATIPQLDQLSRVIGPLFRSALRSTEMRRHVA